MSCKLRYIFLVLLTLSLSTVQGQSFDYGNAWYKFDKNYIKLKVWEEGIHRVSLQDLQNANVVTSGLNPDNLKIIFRGNSIPLYVQKNGNTLDYFEFYGQKNDGRVDSLLYRDPITLMPDGSQQNNIYRSIFTDTTSYFVTWDDGPGNAYGDFFQNSYSNYTPESWFRYQVFKILPDSFPDKFYLRGGGSDDNPWHALNCDYITGEGYVDVQNPMTGSASFSRYSVPTPGYANSGNANQYRTCILSSTSHTHDHSIQVNGIDTYRDTTYGLNIKTHTFTDNKVLTNSTQLRYWAYGSQPDKPDKGYPTWFWIKYDRSFDLGGASSVRIVDHNSPNDTYFQFVNATVGTDAWLYDLTLDQRIRGTVSGDTVRFIVPGSTSPRTLFFVTDQGIKSPIVRPFTSLANLSNTNAGAEYVIITNKVLQSSAQALKNYRDTCTVNPVSSTKIVYVDEIYDEFSYGSITPLGIKRFCKYALDNWQTKPQYFILWGKGRYITRRADENLVPTYGAPATDYEFISNFDPSTQINTVPEAAIGRVNAFDDDDGFAYLEKLNEYEHYTYDSWMKQTIFMGGGKNSGEQFAIKDALVNVYKIFTESAPAAGESFYFQKINNGTESNTTETSEDLINQGVGLFHFFGHSSTNIFDVNILSPNQYQNFGKYPVMLAFGCYGGDFTDDGKSFGESFVLEKGRGSICYLANSTAGFLSQLKEYGLEFYSNAFDEQYGERMGDLIKQTISDFILDNGNHSSNVYKINHARQLNLQGDPMIRMLTPLKPDLEVNRQNVYFSPENFSAQDREFTLNVITQNLGRVTQDSFLLQVIHRSPSGTTTVYDSLKFGPILNLDTLSVTIFNREGPALAGLNNFEIFVDAADSLDEYSESNNLVNFQVLVPGNSPAILYPYEFAVVDQPNISLAAGTYILNTQNQINFVFEIDTVSSFNSSFKVSSGLVSGTSVYASWEVPFTLEADKVYYWRVRLGDVNPVSWSESSFKYLPGKTGWAQSHPPQFLRSQGDRIHLDPQILEWSFSQWTSLLHAWINVSGPEAGKADYFLGASGSNSQYLSQFHGVMYTVIDPVTLESRIKGTQFDSWDFLLFPDAEVALRQQIYQLDDGDYFLMVSQRDPQIGNWDPATIQSLELIGVDADKAGDLPNGTPFIILGKKGGAVGSAYTVYEANFLQDDGRLRPDLLIDLVASFNEGEIQSTLIGPSTNWSEFTLDWSAIEPFSGDDLRVDVYGVTSSRSEALVFQDFQKGLHNIGSIDANLYPTLKLVATARDEQNMTAPQLTEWQVFYDQVPDAALDPVSLFTFNSDTLDEGQIARFEIAARNLSDMNLDSMTVRYSLERQDRSRLLLGESRIAPLAAKASETISYEFNTAIKGLEGDVSLLVELNPDEEIPELHQFNNVFRHDFYVRTDGQNPIMDVTFNGKHIIDGDIVSPDPEIVIQVNDDNPYLPVTISDSTYQVSFGAGRSLSLLSPIAIEGNANITSVPAKLPQNKARLIYRPGRLEDGEYTLRVQAYDWKGNAAGADDYIIHFNVVNQNAISNVLNYPNPFSSRTQFVYTLTGDEIPYVFELHIYTVSGKLVKVIDLVELGEVNYGYNLTDYSWDGRDDNGDLLANGVYVYKVRAKFRSRKTIEDRDEGISNYFKNGIGKLYIMR